VKVFFRSFSWQGMALPHNRLMTSNPQLRATQVAQGRALRIAI
jgi:hypothetical protein